MPTMSDGGGEVILGVDTHEREHVAALLDELGRLLETRSFPANARGYRQVLMWAREHGQLMCAGVEGTGSFGAGLARFLASERVQVVEVTRPSRRGRRHLGKSDAVDAEAAARMVLCGEATATPKRRDGIVEAIRVLQVARRSAIKARTQAGQQIRSLIVTAPPELHGELAQLGVKRQVERLRPDATPYPRGRDGIDAASAAQPRPPLAAARPKRSASSTASCTRSSRPQPRACSPSLESAPTPLESCS